MNVRRFLPQASESHSAQAATSHCGAVPLRDMHRRVTLDVPLQTIFKLADYKQWVNSQRWDLHLLPHLYPLG